MFDFSCVSSSRQTVPLFHVLGARTNTSLIIAITHIGRPHPTLRSPRNHWEPLRGIGQHLLNANFCVVIFQDSERARVRELLEIETIEASKLRYKVKCLPEEIRKEIQGEKRQKQMYGQRIAEKFCAVLFSVSNIGFTISCLSFQMQSTQPDSPTLQI